MVTCPRDFVNQAGEFSPGRKFLREARRWKWVDNSEISFSVAANLLFMYVRKGFDPQFLPAYLSDYTTFLQIPRSLFVHPKCHPIDYIPLVLISRVFGQFLSATPFPLPPYFLPLRQFVLFCLLLSIFPCPLCIYFYVSSAPLPEEILFTVFKSRVCVTHTAAYVLLAKTRLLASIRLSSAVFPNSYDLSV